MTSQAGLGITLELITGKRNKTTLKDVMGDIDKFMDEEGFTKHPRWISGVQYMKHLSEQDLREDSRGKDLSDQWYGVLVEQNHARSWVKIQPGKDATDIRRSQLKKPVEELQLEAILKLTGYLRKQRRMEDPYKCLDRDAAISNYR